MAEALHIYVHWPWCKAKCPYCDFNSHALKDGNAPPEEDYVEAVCAELAEWRRKLAENRPITSVFFGGGTPSLMSPRGVARILESCERLGTLLSDTEITVEANPTSSSKTLFRGLAEAGVNRLSVGVQGLQAERLKFLGREHDTRQAIETLEAALTVTGNVNADVIYGLPGQPLEEWTEQLENMTKIGLSHLSAYQLTIEKNTRFFSDVTRGLWAPVESDAEADFFEATHILLTDQGYENYEISNFSRPDLACRHNLGVWRGEDYLGVGAGAHGRVTLADGTRVVTQVVRQPEGYLTRKVEGKTSLSGWEVINDRRGLQEALFLGLRLKEGVCPPALLKRFGSEAWEAAVDAVELQKMVDANWLAFEHDQMALTATGWPRLNGILKRILRRETPQVKIAYENEGGVS